jgi:hypothetical protein
MNAHNKDVPKQRLNGNGVPLKVHAADFARIAFHGVAL